MSWHPETAFFVISGFVSVHIWKPQRKLLNPTFNNKILKSFIPIFNEKSQILVDVLAKKVGEDAFDVSKQIFACTLDMVCGESVEHNKSDV